MLEWKLWQLKLNANLVTRYTYVISSSVLIAHRILNVTRYIMFPKIYFFFYTNIRIISSYVTISLLLHNFQFLICRRFRCVKVRGEGDEQVSDENLQDTSNESGKKHCRQETNMLVINQRQRHPCWRMLLAIVILSGLIRYCEPMSTKRLTDSSPSSLPTLSRSSGESRSQNLGSPSDLAWQAWLLLGSQTGGHSSLDSASFLKRITPKSVFIAPELPACPDGYQADRMGRCVKTVIINPQAHIGFLLQHLNSRYSNQAGGSEVSSNNKKKSSGPLQLNIPLFSDTGTKSVPVDDEETRGDQSINIPIVVPSREDVRVEEIEEEVEEVKEVEEGKNVEKAKDLIETKNVEEATDVIEVKSVKEAKDVIEMKNVEDMKDVEELKEVIKRRGFFLLVRVVFINGSSSFNQKWPQTMSFKALDTVLRSPCFARILVKYEL